jgi:hypothetical protein
MMREIAVQKLNETVDAMLVEALHQSWAITGRRMESNPGPTETLLTNKWTQWCRENPGLSPDEYASAVLLHVANYPDEIDGLKKGWMKEAMIQADEIASDQGLR